MSAAGRSPIVQVLLKGRASALIALACALVFARQWGDGTAPTDAMFFRNAVEVWSGRPAGFFLSILGHASVEHILVNVLVILLYGAILEARIGALRLLATFAVSGVAGNALGILWEPAVSSIGASGGAMGIVGGLVAHGIRSGRSPWDFFGTVVARPLLLVIALMIGIGFVPGSFLDNAAHFGGMIGGFGFVWLFGAPGGIGRAGLAARIAGLVFLVESTAYALNPVLDARYYATRVTAFGERNEFGRARTALERLERLEPESTARLATVERLARPLESVGSPLPTFARIPYAEVLWHSGRREEANAIVDRIEEEMRALLRPDVLDVAERARLENNLAWLLVVFDRDLDEAWRLAVRATAVARHPAFVGTLGVVALRRGDAEGARRLLEESVRAYVSPRDESSRANDLYYLSIALSQLGRKDDAIRRFEEAREIAPDAAIAEEALSALGPRGV